jgi:two-component system sensor histidine kinase AlgZ
VLLVQAVLAVAGAGRADTAAAGARARGRLAFAGVAGTCCGWCCCVRCGPGWPPARGLARGGAGAGLGAAVALLAWWPLWLAGLAGDGGGLRLLGVPLAGVGFAGCCGPGWTCVRASGSRPTPARGWPSCSRASGRTSCSTR